MAKASLPLRKADGPLEEPVLDLCMELQIQINFHQEKKITKIEKQPPWGVSEMQSHSDAGSGLPIQSARDGPEEAPSWGFGSLTRNLPSVRMCGVRLPEVLAWYSSGASHKANSCPPSSTSMKHSIRCLSQQLHGETTKAGCGFIIYKGFYEPCKTAMSTL